MTHELVHLYNRLQQIHVLLDDGDRRSLNSVNLSSPQYHLLLHLYNKGGDHGLTVSELADLLICTRSNATRLVQRLEQQSLVLLSRDPADRRLVLVSLTPAGLELLLAARTAHQGAIARRFAGLNESELEILSGLADKLAEILENDLRLQPAGMLSE